MKTPKLYWFALIASAALAAQVQAGGHSVGGGGQIGFVGGGGRSSSPAHAAAPSFHSAPRANFGGGRFVAPGQRFSSFGMRSSPAFRPQRFVGSNRAYINRPQLASGTFNHRGDRLGSPGNQRAAGSGFNGRNHIVAREGANWHRDWDRHRDHWWHGHRCRFVNGYWLIFDTGFYPYDFYPYDDYAYDYYPYDYYSDSYGSVDPNYYGEGGYSSSDQYADAMVVAVQARLKKQGYYREKIDGIFGPQTRDAIMRYQRDHGLRVTGNVTPDTLQALGLQEVAKSPDYRS
jgi:hypothetical protein